MIFLTNIQIAYLFPYKTILTQSPLVVSIFCQRSDLNFSCLTLYVKYANLNQMLLSAERLMATPMDADVQYVACEIAKVGLCR